METATETAMETATETVMKTATETAMETATETAMKTATETATETAMETAMEKRPTSSASGACPRRMSLVRDQAFLPPSDQSQALRFGRMSRRKHTFSPPRRNLT